MRFERVRDVLYRLKYTPNHAHPTWTGDGLEKVKLIVLDRSEHLTGEKEIMGIDICMLHRREFTTNTSTIPYYKVVAVYFDGKLVWERPQP